MPACGEANVSPLHISYDRFQAASSIAADLNQSVLH